MGTGRLSSGVAQLDEALDGFLPGDNVVWVTDPSANLSPFIQSFLSDGMLQRRRCIYVRTTSRTSRAMSEAAGAEIIDARRGGKFSDPQTLEETLVAAGRRQRHTCVVVESLDPLVARWGADRVVAFYQRCCPRLFDVYAVAYWSVSRSSLKPSQLDQIAQVAQCFFEIGSQRLKLTKADGHPASAQGQLLHLQQDSAGTVSLSSERALGRLGRGLEAVRHERRLSQAELARLAGVTPSAISQAESGRRGLSLETILVLADRLGVGLDELFETRGRLGYTLARRGDGSEPVATLLSDPAGGFRLHVIRLGAGEIATPPFAAKGTEVVAVAQGLIQIAVGRDTPVLRAGDAIMATKEGVKRWRNLLGEASLLFWILLDAA